MKLQSAKKPFAFIITAMMFSIMPSLLSAQKKCPDGNCPKNQHCVNGVCVKGTQTFCNCLVRPIPFECAAVCGWKGAAGGTISITEATTSKIGFQLQQAQKISVKIYDVTGRLIKAWQEKAFEEGEHVLVWNAPDVNGGLYVIRLDAGTYSETKRIALP